MREDIIKKINNNLLLDESDFIHIAYHHLKKNKDLFLVNDVKFDNNALNIGAYNPVCKDIIFSPDKMNNLAYKTTRRLIDIYHIPENDYPKYINFIYLYILFHELRHVDQLYNHDYNSLETKPIELYTYELSELLQNTKKDLYNNYHDLFPTEVDANNNGFLNSYLYLSDCDIDNRDKNIMLLQLYESILSHYKFVDNKLLSPIELLKRKEETIKMDLFYNLLKEYKIDLKDKLMLGLPINKYEYYKMYVKKKKTLNTINR